ncbi:transposase [Solitalea koreensis]|uniref:Transposase n=1 Tax=Solitalea koreensis TaxID=543615 RepID=A0A521DL04_9SPHI|nr:transposase [Solitalea koreensis]SMO72389.1 transposase [Solitalea koreensis]
MNKKTKYTPDFKLKLVKSVLQAHQSKRSVAKAHGVRNSNLELWVKFYEAYGPLGLEPSKKQYPPAFKIQTVRCILAEQLSLSDACVRFQVSQPSVLLGWLRKYEKEGLEGFQQETRGRKSKDPMPKKIPKLSEKVKSREEQLEEENTYLKAEIAFLKKWYALIQQEEKEKRKKR